jgi:tRNA pseudouridine38-40 synthase
MRNIRLLIEYDGTGYAGWQVQDGEPTVQGSVVGGIKKLTGEEVALVGASRTDAGVHALGQVANFKTSSAIPLGGMILGLNSILPEDIVIKDAREVPLDFNSRRDAKSKTYVYRVLNRTVRSRLARQSSWFVKETLDMELMNKGAELLVGRKDFTSFRAAGSDAPHSVREVTSFTVERRGEFIEFEVRGTAFLRHMVRIMVGTLVTLGTGKFALGDITYIIDAKDRRKVPVTAPPGGLFLKEVQY